MGTLKKVNNGTKKCLNCDKEYKYHTSARPLMGPGTPEQYENLCSGLEQAYRISYNNYEKLLDLNVAKEAARMCLPVAIYSTCWVACNPRSLMHFLSLRTHDDSAKYVSYPQAEIEEVARQYETIFAKYWPITHECFVENGRVGP